MFEGSVGDQIPDEAGVLAVVGLSKSPSLLDLDVSDKVGNVVALLGG